MAEAAAIISLVASIASLVDLSVKVVSRLNDFSSKTSDVPQSFRSLADRLPLLTHTLRSISNRIRAQPALDDVTKDLDHLVASMSVEVSYLEQCLNQVVPGKDSSRLERMVKGLKSLAKEEKIDQAVQKIHHGIDVLVLHQTTASIDNSDRILNALASLDLAHSKKPKGYGLCLSRAPQIEPDAFIGREGEIQDLYNFFSPTRHSNSQRVASIVGMGGLGKTQLSLAYVRKCGSEYSSVFWMSAKDETSVRHGFLALAQMIHPEEKSVPADASDEQARIVTVQTWLSQPANDQWLIIFDNYDDPNLPNTKSVTGFDIRAFFPTRAQGHLLITTRSPKLTFTKRIALRKISEELSIELLAQRSGRDIKNGQSNTHLSTHATWLTQLQR